VEAGQSRPSTPPNTTLVQGGFSCKARSRSSEAALAKLDSSDRSILERHHLCHKGIRRKPAVLFELIRPALEYRSNAIRIHTNPSRHGPDLPPTKANDRRAIRPLVHHAAIPRNERRKLSQRCRPASIKVHSEATAQPSPTTKTKENLTRKTETQTPNQAP